MNLRSRTVRNSANQTRQPTGNTVERRTTKRRDEKERRRTNASRLVLERVVKFIVEETKFYPKMLVIETLDDLEFGPVEELLEVAKEDPILGSVNELWDTHWRWLTERGILDAIKNRIQLTVVPLNEALVCGITELSPSQLRSLMYDRPEETDVSSIVAGHCPVILPCDMDIVNPVAFFKPRNEHTTEVFTFDDIYDVLYPSSMSFRRLVNANGGPICTSPWTGDKHVMQVASALLEDLQYTTAGELEKFGSNRVVSMHDMLYKGRTFICGCCHSDELELRNWKELVGHFYCEQFERPDAGARPRSTHNYTALYYVDKETRKATRRHLAYELPKGRDEDDRKPVEVRYDGIYVQTQTIYRNGKSLGTFTWLI